MSRSGAGVWNSRIESVSCRNELWLKGRGQVEWGMRRLGVGLKGARLIGDGGDTPMVCSRLENGWKEIKLDNT